MRETSIALDTLILLSYLISANKCLAIVFHISSCDVQVYYEVKRPELNYRHQDPVIDQADWIPITSKEFTGAPFKPLSVSAKAKPAAVRKFQLNCHIIIISFSTSHLERRMDFSSIRNPKLLKYSWLQPMWIESENTYIILVEQNSVNLQLNQLMTGFKLKTFKSRMQALSGHHFKIGLHDVNPHYFKLNGRKYGTSVEFMDELASTCNFTYSSSLIPLQISQLPDGSLSGWENEVVYSRVDAQVFYFANYVYHRPNLEFTTPIWKTAIIYVAKVPGRRLKWTAVLGVLEPETWATLGAITILFGLVAYKKLRIGSLLHCEHRKATSSQILFLVFTPLVSQWGGRVLPTRIQYLSLLWIFSAFVMTIYFTSNLLSLITSPVAEESVPKEMVSLEARQDYHIYGLDHPGGPFEAFFNETTVPHLRRLWQRTKLLPMDICVVEAITTPKTVCLGWDFLFEAILQANATLNELFHPAETVNAGLITVYHSVIVRKNSFYADAFGEAVGWFRDTGIYESWLRQTASVTKRNGREWLTAPEQKDTRTFEKLDEAYRRSVDSPVGRLDVTFLVAPAAIMAVGMVVAVVIFLFEKGWLRRIILRKLTRPDPSSTLPMTSTSRLSSTTLTVSPSLTFSSFFNLTSSTPTRRSTITALMTAASTAATPSTTSTLTCTPIYTATTTSPTITSTSTATTIITTITSTTTCTTTMPTTATNSTATSTSSTTMLTPTTISPLLSFEKADTDRRVSCLF